MQYCPATKMFYTTGQRLIAKNGKLVNSVEIEMTTEPIALFSTQLHCCLQRLAQLKQVRLGCYAYVLGVSYLQPASSSFLRVTVFAKC